MYKTTSCLLFHGPESESVALGAAKLYGVLVPFDSSDLRKKGARELVELLSCPPVGSGTRSVVVGPLDVASQATSDVLLKTLEEFDPEGIRPFLWAWDLGGVSKTVRSRCVCQFAPGVDERLVSYLPVGKQMVSDYLTRDYVGLVEGWKESKGDEELVLRAVIEELSGHMKGDSVEPRVLNLWEALRPLCGPHPLTPARILSAFLGASIQ